MRYDFNDGSLRPFNPPALDLNPADYEVKQVFFASKDGTQVPMFITHKQGIALDGNNPTLLWGYGGFNLSKTPEFYRRRDPVALWLEAGGVYVLVNLRGGAEFGEEWHRAGMRERKQNTFDDFIAAGEALIELGYTRSEKLAAIGASNGGLLVAACLLQRPDLFGAVVSEVPVTDMLRYPLFTAGRYWVGEWGDAEADPEAFRYLHAYSPYHNVVQGESYPPTLIHTATSDDRVVPLHAYKFAAMLQEKDSGLNPIYLSVETKAGHGEGKPTGKLIAYFADIYAFLFDRLGMEIAE
jgi:prolyl oligopeptidase